MNQGSDDIPILNQSRGCTGPKYRVYNCVQLCRPLVDELISTDICSKLALDIVNKGSGATHPPPEGLS